jgi:tetratricopeptide (TPR) repeat protein
MSFMTDLKDLVKEANSNLQDLKVLLHEAQPWGQGHNDVGPNRGERTPKNPEESADGIEERLSPRLEMEQACQRVSQALQQIEAAYNLNQSKLTQLEGELVVHLETLKQDALEHFARGQYRECLGIVSFLCQLEPHNRTLLDYLELSRQKLLVAEPVDGPAASLPSLAQGPAGVERMRAESPQQSFSCSLEAGQSETEIRSNEGPSLLDQSQEGKQLLQPSAGQPELSTPIQQHVLKPEFSRDSEQPAGTGQSSFHPNWQRKRRPMVSSVVGTLVLFGLLVGLKSQFSYRQRGANPGPQPSPAGAEVSLLQAPPSPLEALQDTALALFNQGRLSEAERYCDDLLAQDPQNPLALTLKEKIQVYFLEQSRLAKPQSPAEEAPVTPSPVVTASPGQVQSLDARKAAKPEVKASPAVGPREGRMEADVQRLHQAIVQALASANYFPPTSGNALELIRRLERLAPSDDFGPAKRDQLYQELVVQVRQKLQAQQFDQARGLLEQLQRHFPEQGDHKRLLGSVASRPAPPPAPRHWIERAELALSAGQYVTPAQDNALLNCNRALALDPANSKALQLKQQSINQAVGQARDWAHSGLFEEARQLYAALYYLSQNERDFPLPVQELKQELEKLEFRAYPVIHEHTFGSCTGRLRMNAYAISFVPSTDSKDGFTESLSGINVGDPGPKLKIKVGNKNYRFQANLALDKEDNQEKVKVIYEQLIGLVAKAR